jgi:hypothetical protein
MRASSFHDDTSERHCRMSPVQPGTGSDGPHPEDPNRFSDDGVAAIDEAPDGRTPADATESSADSLPPGAGQKRESPTSRSVEG